MFGSLRNVSGATLAAGALALALSGAPQGAQAQSPCAPAVTVSQGDTLYRIATRCGTTVTALVNANPQITNPNRIEIGQTIQMPGAIAGRPSPQARGLAPGQYYTVRPGDTFFAISRQFGIPVQVLLSLNPRIDPHRLRAGIDIRLPGDRDRPRRDRPRRDRPDEVTISGVITGEGVECPAMRGRDGQLYTLTGNVGDLQPGDRVEVRGQRAEVSICMQGTTIEVRRIRRG
jgi:LysM repeat protein